MMRKRSDILALYNQESEENRKILDDGVKCIPDTDHAVMNYMFMTILSFRICDKKLDYVPDIADYCFSRWYRSKIDTVDQAVALYATNLAIYQKTGKFMFTPSIDLTKDFQNL